ncbi:MAG: UPF0147 family protein [archaeon]
MDINDRIKQICDLMQPVIDDTSVPRNIRKTVEDAKNRICQGGDVNVNLASAIYSLEDVSNDINMPFHVRTSIWSIVSELERLKEEMK